MAIGNTFGATALSSYGGFWIATAIILTPGGFGIEKSLTATDGSALAFLNSFGLFLMVRTPHEPLRQHEADLRLGLVHLHILAPALHAQIHSRLLLPVLDIGPCLPDAGHRLLGKQCRRP